ncbi:IS3 family transposase [Streptomyces sp. NPDC055287]
MTALLDEHPHLGVEPVLLELSVPSSTYYRWRRAEREPCERVRRDRELTEQIKGIHADSGGIYGSPRVHAVLKREGVHVGRKRVERLMREADLAGKAPSQVKRQTQDSPLGAGLIAFGAGMLTAALLPTTEAEERAGQKLREHSDELLEPVKQTVVEAAQEVKEETREPAAQAVEAVKGTAEEAAEATGPRSERRPGDGGGPAPGGPGRR